MSRLAIVLLIVLSVLTTVGAQLPPAGTGGYGDSPMISLPIWTLVCRVLYDAMLNIAGSLAAVVFVFAGIQYIVAADDPGKRKASKDLMIYAIVGILIVALTGAIINAVMPPGCA